MADAVYPYMGLFTDEADYRQWLADSQAEADEYEMNQPVEPFGNHFVLF
jgi:hypothetical protein